MFLNVGLSVSICQFFVIAYICCIVLYEGCNNTKGTQCVERPSANVSKENRIQSHFPIPIRRTHFM